MAENNSPLNDGDRHSANNLNRARLIEAHLRRALELMLGEGTDPWYDQEMALSALVSEVRAYRREELEDVYVNEVYLYQTTTGGLGDSVVLTNGLGSGRIAQCRVRS